MKRALFLLLVAAPAFALTTTKPLTHGDRIAVLRISDDFAQDVERDVASTLQKALRKELRARGFDAYETDLTFEDARREPAAADYYIEIVSGRSADREFGGIGAAVGHAVVDVSIVTARVAAELRLYDAKTMELIDRYDLARHKTAIVPTGVGIGTRAVWAYVALPFINHAQYRAATRAIARDAAERIANR
jgi:hypothetical protein